jgi:late competence protein required for DNA uptake (superfamily II DNA/RNA helicase)
MEQDARHLVNTERRTILCPRCEQDQPMRDFATLGMSPLYAEALVPIFRCKQCNHLFAPRPQAATLLTVAVNGTSANGNGVAH